MTEYEEDVLQAAHEWWIMKQPLAWNRDEFLADPEVNSVTPAERKLARAIAKWLTA